MFSVLLVRLSAGLNRNGWSDFPGPEKNKSWKRTIWIQGPWAALVEVCIMSNSIISLFSLFYPDLVRDRDSFPVFLPEQFPVWALPLWSWDAPLLWSRARLYTTALTFPSSCSQPEMHHITSVFTRKDEGTPRILSAGWNILGLLSHLAFQHNTALWGHLITQILNKVRTWSTHGREHGKI